MDESERDSIPKMSKIPIIKSFIDHIIVSKFKDILSQINVNNKGDIEMRFRNESDLLNFLQTFPTVNINNSTVHIARKKIGDCINIYRYSIQFFVTGEAETQDILEELEVYGERQETITQVISGTSIRTG